MKILNLTREDTTLQFSINELTMLKNLLMEAWQLLTVADFKERIHGISKDEALQLSNTIGEIVDLFQQDSRKKKKNQLIQAIQFSENYIILRLTYPISLGLRSILNELCHGICAIQDFSSRVGFNKSDASLLLDFIHFDVVEKMQEGSLENLIFKKSKEIENSLNLKYKNLEVNSSSPKFKKECILRFKSKLLVFSLFSLENRKVFSGIQIAVDNLSKQTVSFIQSSVQAIRHSDLVRLIAYIELALTFEINKADLEEFTLSIYNSRKSILFDIKVLPEEIGLKSEDIGIHFRFYPDIQENSVNDEYLDIEDISSVSNIYLFTSSIRAFLSELVRKQLG